MNHTLTIISKQLKETPKNAAVLIQFIMFPALALLMSKAVHIENMDPNYFVLLFSSMYIGMAPLSSITSIIAEEKEQNTLRVLRMAKVTPLQYLSGIGLYVLFFCSLGSLVFCLLLTGMTPADKGRYLLLMLIGIVSSGVLGAAIGVGSKSQMAATSISIPVMIIFSFLPMLSMFNDTIHGFAKFAYTEQLRLLMDPANRPGIFCILVLIGNITVFFLLFLLLYRRKGLE